MTDHRRALRGRLYDEIAADDTGTAQEFLLGYLTGYLIATHPDAIPDAIDAWHRHKKTTPPGEAGRGEPKGIIP